MIQGIFSAGNYPEKPYEISLGEMISGSSKNSISG